MTNFDSDKSENGNSDISAEQEKLLLDTMPVIKRIASSKLSFSYRDFIEDITQKVFLKLWNWKSRRENVVLNEEEWKKLANTATQNEIRGIIRETKLRAFIEACAWKTKILPSLNFKTA